MASTSVPLAPRASAQTSSDPGLLIPLYIYPGSAWNTIIQEKEAHPNVPITVVVNPDDGPGTTWSSTYDSWIVALRDAGINVLGYVPTEYASVSISAAESEIAAWKQMYWVSGIFLDQMTNNPSYESYYTTLTDYAHSDDFYPVVGNAGTGVSSGFIGTVDVIVVYEDSNLPSPSLLQGLTMGDSPSNFAVLSYGVPGLPLSTPNLLATYASYIYVTTGSLPSPYSTLPWYFDNEVADMQLVPVPDYSFVVQSVTSSGAPLDGMWTVGYYNGSEIGAGFTPVTYTQPAGNPYTICAYNFGIYTFSHWEDGLTTPCRTFQLDQDRTFTATYNT